MIEIMGLWEKEDKNGNLMLNGSLGKSRVFIFKNTYKEEDKHPDYKLYMAEKQKDNE